MNPICLFFFLKRLEEFGCFFVWLIYFFPSRRLVINNSSPSPDENNPDLVKAVLVAAMVYSAGSFIQVETGIFSFDVVMSFVPKLRSKTKAQ